MRKEIIDKNSGAILFKKDSESAKIDELIKRVDKLESENKDLKKRLRKLEK